MEALASTAAGPDAAAARGRAFWRTFVDDARTILTPSTVSPAGPGAAAATAAGARYTFPQPLHRTLVPPPARVVRSALQSGHAMVRSAGMKGEDQRQHVISTRCVPR